MPVPKRQRLDLPETDRVVVNVIDANQKITTRLLVGWASEKILKFADRLLKDTPYATRVELTGFDVYVDEKRNVEDPTRYTEPLYKATRWASEGWAYDQPPK